MLVDQAKLTGSITDADLRAAAKLYNIPESSLQSLKTALEADPAVKKLMEPKPTDIAAYTPQVFTGRAPEPITIAANSPDVLILKDGLRPLSAAKDAFGEPDSGLPKTFAAASEKPAPVAPGNDLDRDYAAKPTGPTVSINA